MDQPQPYLFDGIIYSDKRKRSNSPILKSNDSKKKKLNYKNKRSLVINPLEILKFPKNE